MHCATPEVVVLPSKTRRTTIIRERSVLTQNFDLASTLIGMSSGTTAKKVDPEGHIYGHLPQQW